MGTSFQVTWTIGGSACHYARLVLLPLSCTRDMGTHDEELTIVSSGFEGVYLAYIVDSGGHMGGAPASDKNRGAGQTAMSCPPYVLLLAMKHSPLLVCAFFVLSASLALDVSAGVVQIIDGSLAYTETLQKFAANARPHVVQKRANGKVQAAYFSNWYILCCPESFY